jgi:hypothetical protein
VSKEPDKFLELFFVVPPFSFKFSKRKSDKTVKVLFSQLKVCGGLGLELPAFLAMGRPGGVKSYEKLEVARQAGSSLSCSASAYGQGGLVCGARCGWPYLPAWQSVARVVSSTNIRAIQTVECTSYSINPKIFDKSNMNGNASGSSINHLI